MSSRRRVNIEKALQGLSSANTQKVLAEVQKLETENRLAKLGAAGAVIAFFIVNAPAVVALYPNPTLKIFSPDEALGRIGHLTVLDFEKKTRSTASLAPKQPVRRSAVS